MQEKLKDNFDFNQMQVLSAPSEESKSAQKPKADDSDGFFDTISSSTQVTKEEKQA
ncbi:MAG: hypothetical protein ACK521_04285 [bacterium]